MFPSKKVNFEENNLIIYSRYWQTTYNGQLFSIQATNCFYIYFLKSYKTKICDKEHMWPTVPKIIYCLAPHRKCLLTAGLQAKANKESIK